MITVDILSPVGGLHGGIENVINTWIKFIDHDRFNLRIVHLSPGIAYLKGYKKAYQYIGPGNLQGDERLSYYLLAYTTFINDNGAPDICIATNYPTMSAVAMVARDNTKSHYRILSWTHTNLKILEENGHGSLDYLLCADAHLVLSKTTENIIKNRNQNTITYNIGNPVKLQNFINKNARTNSLAFVGRLELIKRVDIILEALYRANSNWSLKIVGSDDQEEELKKICSYLRLDDRVSFLGWQDNPWSQVEDCDAFVLASEYEGYALVCAEALSMGMTVISTPVDGVVDYIIPGKNGYLFPINDAISLAQILDYLDNGTLPLCDRKTCRDSILDQNEEKYMDKIMHILDEEYRKL